MDEPFFQIARVAFERLDEDEWGRAVDLARELTPDRMSLDELPAVALALKRATGFMAVMEVAVCNGPPN